MKKNRKGTHCPAGKCTSSSKNPLHAYYHREGIYFTNPSVFSLFMGFHFSDLPTFEAPTSAVSSDTMRRFRSSHLSFPEYGSDTPPEPGWVNPGSSCRATGCYANAKDRILSDRALVWFLIMEFLCLCRLFFFIMFLY